MKQSEIAAFSGTPFTNQEISNLKVILFDQSYKQTESLVDTLTILDADGEPVADALQTNRKMLRSQIAVWFDKFRDGTIAIKGGKKGTDYSNQRDKEDLRGEVRRSLGLPEVPPEKLAMQLYGRRTSSTTFTTRSY